MLIKVFSSLVAFVMILCGCSTDKQESLTESINELVNDAIESNSDETKEEENKAMVIEIDPSKPVIALTFDDGPNTTTTNEVLDILEKYKVVASFFVVGQNINDETSKVIKRAFDWGCEINNHSKTHSYMDKMTAEDIKAEIKYTSDKVFEITGQEPNFFRPPYIAVNKTMYEAIDLPFICGDGANDWDDRVTADRRAARIIKQAKDGGIILLHDAQGNSKTVEALDTIIPSLLDQGYQFVTVSQLFETKGVKPKDNIIYSSTDQKS